MVQSLSLVAVRYLLELCHPIPFLPHLAALGFLRYLEAIVQMNLSALGSLDFGECFPKILAALRAYDQRTSECLSSVLQRLVLKTWRPLRVVHHQAFHP